MGLATIMNKLDDLHQLSLEQYKVADELLHRLFEIPKNQHFLDLVLVDDAIHLNAFGVQMKVSKNIFDTQQGEWRTHVKFQSPTSDHTTYFFCNEQGHIFQERHDIKPTVLTEDPQHLESLMDLLLDNLEPISE